MIDPGRRHATAAGLAAAGRCADAPPRVTARGRSREAAVARGAQLAARIDLPPVGRPDPGRLSRCEVPARVGGARLTARAANGEEV